MKARVMTKLRRDVWAGLQALLFGGWAVCVQAVTTNVNLTAVNTFSPSAVTIKPNDTVQWTWAGNSHSTTSQSTPALWDSGIHNMPFTFSFTFTNPGVYPYHCSNPFHTSMTGSVTVNAANSPPSVTVTNPANNTVFSAPATFVVGATASDADGTVTNVQFLMGTTSLTNDTTSPYGAGVTNLGVGAYTFFAIASDNNGGKMTNSISLSVVTAAPVVLSAPTRISPTQFRFNYTANTGLTYVVERSVSLTGFFRLNTNTAGGTNVVFTDGSATNPLNFYRVGRLPNP